MIDDLQDRDSLNLLTALIWGEARSEDAIGKLAVALVVDARMRDSRWPDTYNGVILQSAQFSCMTPGDPNYEQVNRALLPSCNGNWGNASWRECRWAAQSIISGYCRDFTNGANHYYATWIEKPEWAQGYLPCFEHQEHIFYCL